MQKQNRNRNRNKNIVNLLNKVFLGDKKKKKKKNVKSNPLMKYE